MRGLFVGAIRAYQRWVSPMLPPACKYQPTCSEYAVGAIEAQGVVRGVLWGAWRILRCNPFSAGGFDPVPPRRA